MSGSFDRMNVFRAGSGIDLSFYAMQRLSHPLIYNPFNIRSVGRENESSL